MALEGANVLGSNVVYNTNNSLNTYNKAIQQQQLKAQAEQKSLMEELGSVKADGIREKDIPGYNARFQKWRDSSIQASKETDPEKKMILQSNESRNKNDLSNFTVRSNDQKKLRAGIGTHYVGKDPLEDYTPTDWDKYRKSDDLSIDDPNYVSDLSQFQIRPDVEGFLKDFSATNDNLLKSKGVFINQKGESVTSGRDSGTIFRNVKVVDPKVQQQEYMLKLTDPKRYKTVQAMYPDLASTLPKDEFIKQASARLTQQYPIKDESSPTIHWISKEPQGSGLINSIGEPSRQVFQGVPPTNPATGVATGAKPKSIYSNNFISYDGGVVSFPQLQGVFNVSTQKTETMPSVKAANITGLGHFPTTADGKNKYGKQLMLSVVPENGKNFLIPESKIPQDLKNSKKYQAVLSKLGSAPTQQPQQSQQSTSTSNKQSKQFVSKSGIKVTVE